MHAGIVAAMKTARKPRPKCKQCHEKTSAKDGLCFRCWKAANPGKPWPYARASAKEEQTTTPRQPSTPQADPHTGSTTAPSRPRLVVGVVKPLDVECLTDVIEAIDTLLAKRAVESITPSRHAYAISVLYDIVMSDTPEAPIEAP